MNCLSPFAFRRINHKLESHTGVLLQVLDHSEQILRIWIPACSQHSHKTLRGFLQCSSERLETNCCIDVITKKNLRNFKFATNNRLQCFRQEPIAKFRITIGAFFDGFFEISCKCHYFLFFFLGRFAPGSRARFFCSLRIFLLRFL